MKQEQMNMGQLIRRQKGVLASIVLLLALLVVSPVLAQTNSVTITTTDNVNLRAMPGARSPRLAVIPYGTQLTGLAVSADGLWVSVVYYDVLGWVSLEYVTVDSGSLADLPIWGGLAQPPANDAPPPGPAGEIDALFALWEALHGVSTTATEETTETVDALIITAPTSGLDLPSDRVHLVWQAVSGAESYRVEVYSDQAEVTYTASYRTTATSMDVPTSEMPARSLGWGYWIEVTALDKNGNVLAEGSIWGRRVSADPTPSASTFGPPRR
jgi:hypothetical protein